MNISLSNVKELNVRNSSIGDFCSATCKVENDVELFMAVIYITSNKIIDDNIVFLKRVLAEYNEKFALLISHDFHKLPFILIDDFNINFTDENAQLLIQFILEKLNLTIMYSNPAQSTTKYRTTIDAVFSRLLNKI